MNETNKPPIGVVNDAPGMLDAGDGRGGAPDGGRTLREGESSDRDFASSDDPATYHHAKTGKLISGSDHSPAGPEATSAPLPVFGRYETRRLLASGGFGAVYLGYDNHLQRAVAIKVPRYSSDALKQQFLDEARHLAQLRHPGIVAVHDVGIQGDQCYIVSDYLPGTTLRDWQQQRPPAWPEAARIVAALAGALAHAHAHRVVHRDLKPENVVLVDGKDPVIVDFGIAVSDVAPGNARRGQIAGTLAYMAPEQASGEGHRIDGRTDIYALGVILYELLTGRLPFKGRDPYDVLLQIARDEPQPPRQLNPEIPRQLEHICLKAMAKSVTERYTTAADVEEELRELLQRATGRSAAAGPDEPIVAPTPVTSRTRQAALESTPPAIESA